MERMGDGEASSGRRHVISFRWTRGSDRGRKGLIRGRRWSPSRVRSWEDYVSEWRFPGYSSLNLLLGEIKERIYALSPINRISDNPVLLRIYAINDGGWEGWDFDFRFLDFLEVYREVFIFFFFVLDLPLSWIFTTDASIFSCLCVCMCFFGWFGLVSQPVDRKWLSTFEL